ncbi:MAG: DUF1574 family protein [Chloroflexi bacterium]|nr:DUF1574 family protein [Chloroflexota bacterium]
MDYQKDINQKHPRIILAGDSVLHYGVDPDALANGTGKSVYSISIQGSASATWYLLAKNVIVPGEFKPLYLIIFFRDTMLTTPDFRVDGSYLKQIDELAGSDEKLLLQLSYINQMSSIEKAADQYFPPYGAHQLIWQTINKHNRTILPRMFLDCDLECTDTAMAWAMNKDDFENNLQGDAIRTADDQLYKAANLDFNRQLPRSFLPEIIRLCRDNNIQLILVRTKVKDFSDPASEPQAVGEYIQFLSAYASQNNVILLDFAHDDRLGPDLFRDGVHLTADGKAKFTKILGEALQAIIH